MLSMWHVCKFFTLRKMLGNLVKFLAHPIPVALVAAHESEQDLQQALRIYYIIDDTALWRSAIVRRMS